MRGEGGRRSGRNRPSSSSSSSSSIGSIRKDLRLPKSRTVGFLRSGPHVFNFEDEDEGEGRLPTASPGEPPIRTIGHQHFEALTTREHRTRILRLGKGRFSTSETTNSETLTGRSANVIYSLSAKRNDAQNVKQTTSQRQTNDEPTTSNVQGNNETRIQRYKEEGATSAAADRFSGGRRSSDFHSGPPPILRDRGVMELWSDGVME